MIQHDSHNNINILNGDADFLLHGDRTSKYNWREGV